MKKLLLWSFFALMLVASSCEDEYSSSSTSGDHCAILGMTLGTLKRTVTITRTSDGVDTTYQTTISGSIYGMQVDQLNHEIHNPDSLPVGTDASKIVFSSISADGYIFYDGASGNDTIYTSGDTLDFRRTRYFTCYSYSGIASQTYAVSVLIHEEDPETWHWTEMPSLDVLESAEAQKLAVVDETLYLFVEDAEGGLTLLTSPTDDGETWTEETMYEAEGVDVASVMYYDGAFIALRDNKIVRLEDGEWVDVGCEEEMDALLAAGTDRVYAVQGENALSSSDLQEWTVNELDDSGSLLPQTNLGWAVIESSANAQIENIIVSGTSASGDDALWKKTSLIGSTTHDDPWGYYPMSEEIAYPYPFFDNNTIVNYNDRLFCFGTENDTISLFYESEDYARNWIANDSTDVRPNATSATSLGVAVDGDYYLWITCGGSGKILRGRMNDAIVNVDEDDEEDEDEDEDE